LIWSGDTEVFEGEDTIICYKKSHHKAFMELRWNNARFALSFTCELMFDLN
jgi:hypothetical protein